MAKQQFRSVRLSLANKIRLGQINNIIEEYQSEGYVLTLRQLYYQLVSRDIIPNKLAEYSKLSTLLKEGRMGGIVDWDAIEDRLRKPDRPSEFDSPKEILQAALNQYRLPRMAGQENYVEVWVEKDALSGVLKRVTYQYGIPILVNRGYSSASAMFDSYQRFEPMIKEKKKVYLLYLGDFDPSGMDMIRDIRDRILEFFFGDNDIMNIAEEETDYYTNQETNERLRDEYEYSEDKIFIGKDYNDEEFFDIRRAWLFEMFSVVPIALTREQIRQYKPPPNPAKKTDPRAKAFISEHGSTSWEVDALKPEILNAILTNAIKSKIDGDTYNEVLDKEKKDKKKLEKIIKEFK